MLTTPFASQARSLEASEEKAKRFTGAPFVWRLLTVGARSEPSYSNALMSQNSKTEADEVRPDVPWPERLATRKLPLDEMMTSSTFD